MTETEPNGVMSLSKRIQVIGGAMLVAGTILAFVWKWATMPIIEAIQDERVARQFADSLIVNQISSLAKAMVYLPGSHARELAVRSVTRAPAQLEEQEETHGGNE